MLADAQPNTVAVNVVADAVQNGFGTVAVATYKAVVARDPFNTVPDDEKQYGVLYVSELNDIVGHIVLAVPKFAIYPAVVNVVAVPPVEAKQDAPV